MRPGGWKFKFSRGLYEEAFEMMLLLTVKVDVRTARPGWIWPGQNE